MKILVTGATGFVGSKLTKKLSDIGYEFNILTRSPKDLNHFSWDDLDRAFEGVGAVIHLAGESIAEGRWSEKRKQRILSSRVETTKKLVDYINEHPTKIHTFVSTSAIGIYGDRGEEEISEASEVADDYLANVCKSWEAPLSDLSIRKVILRVGIVLGKDGGALQKMLPPFKMGVGGRLGSGKQYMSWIHIDDLVELYLKSVQNTSYECIINAVSPNPLTNIEFTKALGRALKRPVVFPVPSLALKLAFGDMSQILLEGQRVFPERAKELGFKFAFKDLDECLKDLV